MAASSEALIDTLLPCSAANRHGPNDNPISRCDDSLHSCLKQPCNSLVARSGLLNTAS